MDCHFEQCTIDEFVKSYDLLKKKNPRIYTNAFQGIKFFEECFEKFDDCKILKLESSFFVLIPSFDFYEVYFYSESDENLGIDLKILESCPGCPSNLKIKTVSRNEAVLDSYKKVLFNDGFEEKGRILRFTSANKEIKTTFIEALKELSSIVPENLQNVGFAQYGDGQGILDLLLTEFDPVIDSLPDVQEIEENIKKNQVIVVKTNEGKIISLCYYSIENNILNVIYECTSEEYRTSGVYHLMKYFYYTNENTPTKCTRCYSWRNATKGKLIKASKLAKDLPDGTVITIFFKSLAG